MKKKIKKNFKQKSFFFEDYNEFEITFNKKDIISENENIQKYIEKYFFI